MYLTHVHCAQLSNTEALSAYVFGSKSNLGSLPVARSFESEVIGETSGRMQSIVSEHAAWLKSNCDRQLASYRQAPGIFLKAIAADKATALGSLSLVLHLGQPRAGLTIPECSSKQDGPSAEAACRDLRAHAWKLHMLAESCRLLRDLLVRLESAGPCCFHHAPSAGAGHSQRRGRKRWGHLCRSS